MTEKSAVGMFAYACDPRRGSEPGNGWNWALALANAGVRVHLITQADNRPNIESAKPPDNLSMFYVTPTSLPSILPSRARMYLRYVSWLYRSSRRFAATPEFRECALLHHTTWAGLFFGSRIHRTHERTVLGPLGGAQEVPSELREALSPPDRLTEGARALLYRHALKLSGAASSLRSSALVLASSRAAQDAIRRVGGVDAALVLPDGLRALPPLRTIEPRAGTLRVVWLGRCLPIKGLNIAVKAVGMASARQSIKFSVIGDGPERASAERDAQYLGLGDVVTFLGALPHDNAMAELQKADLLLFTSLRDTFGAQVLEAMSVGTPVLALAHHGVGDHCPDTAVRKVMPTESVERTCAALAEELVNLGASPDVLRDLALEGRSWASTQIWSVKAERLLREYSRIGWQAP